MGVAKKTKKIDVHRYKVTSKSKTIFKLICLWSKSQSSRKQSITFVCEIMRKTFGDGDLISNVVKSQNEKVLTVMREFTSDVCSVSFNSKDVAIPVFIDIAFYKDKDMDARMYEWLDEQTSIVNSISFAVYSFIRLFGIRDTMSVIADIVLKDRNIFDVFEILSSDVADEPEQPMDEVVKSVDVERLF